MVDLSLTSPSMPWPNSLVPRLGTLPGIASMAKGGSTTHLAFHAMAQHFGTMVRYSTLHDSHGQG